jgi:hypothetical protein
VLAPMERRAPRTTALDGRRIPSDTVVSFDVRQRATPLDVIRPSRR